MPALEGALPPPLGGLDLVPRSLPTLSTTPYIAASCLSGAECAALVALFESRKPMSSRLTGGGAHSGIRLSDGLWIDDSDAPFLGSRLGAVASAAIAQAFPFDIDGFEEGYQMLRYNAPLGGMVSGGFYDWHVDIGSFGSARSRKLTIIVQLSDANAYEGGALEVDMNGDAEVMPRGAGCAIVFPSFALHRVLPVESGVRHSLVAWMHGPAFR